MYKYKIFSSVTILLAAAGPFAVAQAEGIEDSIHAYYADEHNVPDGQPTGNRVLEIDIKNMTLVSELPVDGLTNHHADSGFSSKVYAVPKGSDFVNSVKLKRDGNGGTSMEVIKKIPLIHKPRSGDAYNKELGVILMVARNRPMGTFIDTVTDEVLGTIGEDVDCSLTSGGTLLAQENPNDISHQCVTPDYGGDQVSGHPYWLTSEMVAIVDRTNRQISVYRVSKDGNGALQSSLVGHTSTRTSIHQIVPRDRTGLPVGRQVNYFAIEEGSPAQNIPPALLWMKLSGSGLTKIQRISLGRYVDSDYNTNYSELVDAHCDWAANNLSGNLRKRYLDFFLGITTYKRQDVNKITKPSECINTQNQGGHNADFDTDKRHLYIGSKEGHVFVVDVFDMVVKNIVDTGSGYGSGSGSGHSVFVPGKNLAIVTNHTAPYMTAINTQSYDKIQDIPLDFEREGIFGAVQSHTGYASSDGQYYYNFWTDGGVYYKIDTASLSVVSSLKTGGIPIQGSYIKLSNIDEVMDLEARDDAVTTAVGTAVTIDVLDNDTGNNASVANVTGVDNGTAEVVNNQIVYTPSGDNGTSDVIEYEVVDEAGKTNTAEVVVTVAEGEALSTSSEESIAGAGGGAATEETLDDAPASDVTVSDNVGGEVGDTGSEPQPVEGDGGIGDGAEDPQLPGGPGTDSGTGGETDSGTGGGTDSGTDSGTDGGSGTEGVTESAAEVDDGSEVINNQDVDVSGG